MADDAAILTTVTGHEVRQVVLLARIWEKTTRDHRALAGHRWAVVVRSQTQS